jgi:hypothetical protein
MAYGKSLIAEELLGYLHKYGDDFITIEAPPNQKAYEGATFYTVKFNTGDVKFNGRINIAGCKISIGAQEPRNEKGKEPTTANFAMTAEDNPTLLNFFEELQPVWMKKVAEAKSKGIIKKAKLQELDFYKTVYGEQTKDQTKVGQPLPSPLINVKVPLNTYSETHEKAHLRGKPRTIIEDYKRRKLVNGKKRYMAAAVLNEQTGEMEPLNVYNARQFLTSGSVLHPFSELDISSTCVSPMGVSYPLTLKTAVVESKPFEAEGAEADDNDEYDSQLVVEAAPKNAPKVADQPADEDDEAEEEDGEDEEEQADNFDEEDEEEEIEEPERKGIENAIKASIASPTKAPAKPATTASGKKINTKKSGGK